MAGMIYIPGGVKTARCVELGRYYLLYRCADCRSEVLSEQVLERADSRSLTGVREQSRPETNGAAYALRDPTGEERAAAFAALEARFQGEDYSPLERMVKCPRCGRVQPWSGMGKPWKRSLLAILTGAALLVSILALRVLAGDPTILLSPALAFVPLGFMILLDLGYILRRRKRLAAVRALPELPEYYGPDRLGELRESRYGALLKPYLGEK